MYNNDDGPDMAESLLTGFLGEYVLMYLSGGMNTSITTEDGQTATVPLALEGIVYDFDERFVLLGDETKTQFSLVSLATIAKIDTYDRDSKGEKLTPSEFN